MTKLTAHSKAVLITGGAVRLGREIALHLAAQGWHVAIHYRHSAAEATTTAQEINAMGAKAITIGGDLSDEDMLDRLPAAAAEALEHPITALVNNAAAFGKDDLSSLSRRSWLEHMDTNLYAPLRLTQSFVRQLPDGADGAVVNLVDGCESLCLSPQFLTYSLSKYGLAEATRLLAQDLAPQVRVNGVSPGLTLPKEGEEDMFGRLVAKLPLQTATEPEDIARAVAYLLNTPSITGHILPLDGGAALRRRI
jgi:NAD(P)-dependent dehydrogenase (short-subunit alcohol dehydrogenase family)